MHVDVIDRFEVLSGLKNNWDSVHEADPEAAFFLSWTWQSKWLESQDIDWLVLAVKPEPDAPYVAFFPLKHRTRMRKEGGFYDRLSMAGGRVADYTGFICAPEFDDLAIPAMSKFLSQMNWAELEMRDLSVSSDRLELLLHAFRTPEFEASVSESLVESNIELCKVPRLELPEDWGSYLTGYLGSNSRQKVRRYLRKVDNTDEFRVTFADADTLTRDMNILLRFWEARWMQRRPAAGRQTVPRIFRTMLLHCFKSGELLLPVLWAGEKPVAAMALLVDRKNKSILFFFGGRDEEFRSPPPGFVLHSYCIRHAIKEGYRTYDFLRGDEAYKYDFGAKDWINRYVVVRTASRRNIGDRLDARSIQIVLRRGANLYDKEKFVQAETGYKQVLAIEPSSTQALLGLGKCLARRRSYGDAARTFKSYVELRPSDHQAWYRLGKARAANGDMSAAAEAYRQTLALRPKSAPARKALDEILMRAGGTGDVV